MGTTKFILPVLIKLTSKGETVQVLAHRVKGTESPFSLYISNLPVGVPGVPMFFPRAALTALDYAPVTHQVRMRCQWLLNFAQGALQPLPDTPDDPFAGTVVDANALGTTFVLLAVVMHPLCCQDLVAPQATCNKLFHNVLAISMYTERPASQHCILAPHCTAPVRGPLTITATTSFHLSPQPSPPLPHSITLPTTSEVSQGGHSRHECCNQQQSHIAIHRKAQGMCHPASRHASPHYL